MRILLLALLTAAPLAAQTVSPPSQEQQAQQATAQSVLLTQTPSQGCPVGFTAVRTPGGDLVQTRKSSSAQQRELGYRLSFDTHPSNRGAITAAHVLLHGLSGAAYLQVSPKTEASDTEQFSLAAPADHALHFDTVVYARKLTGVQSIELTELTYADGTRWQESSANPCRITPNGFTPVALTH